MYKALQTIVIKIDGRELQLTEGEEVELSVNDGTVLAAGGYVESVEEDAPPAKTDPTDPIYDWQEKPAEG